MTAVFVDLVGLDRTPDVSTPRTSAWSSVATTRPCGGTSKRYGARSRSLIGDAVVAVTVLRPPTRTTPSERCVRRSPLGSRSPRGNDRTTPSTSTCASGSRPARRSSRSTRARRRGSPWSPGRDEHRGADPGGSAGGRHPRRRRHAPRDRAGDRLPGARARGGEGEDRPGRGVGGRRGDGPRLRPRGRRLVISARREGERACAAPRRVRPRARRALTAARDPRRRTRDREEQARDRAPRGGVRGRGDHHLAVRPLPALRRRGHVLGTRGDRQGAGGNPRERHRRARRGEARPDGRRRRPRRRPKLGRGEPAPTRRARRGGRSARRPPHEAPGGVARLPRVARGAAAARPRDRRPPVGGRRPARVRGRTRRPRRRRTAPRRLLRTTGAARAPPGLGRGEAQRAHRVARAADRSETSSGSSSRCSGGTRPMPTSGRTSSGSRPAIRCMPRSSCACGPRAAISPGCRTRSSE